MSRIGALLMAVWLWALPLISPVGEEAPRQAGEGVFRALLVGCDHFVTQSDTWPAAENSVQILGDALLKDTRNYELIRSCANTVTTVDGLRAAVEEAFGGAAAGDTSLLYIATHGVFSEEGSNADAALILSDGEKEELLHAEALQEMLDAVPGRKVLILDACHAGALIGKGLSGGADRISFAGPDYKVLCSAGGSEVSWYYQDARDASAAGASYFAAVLADGMTSGAADVNADGDVTLPEIYAYLMENFAASTPQMYPQNDGDCILFRYDPEKTGESGKAVTGLTLETALLTAGKSRVSFYFTVHRETELYYQVVYYENGGWNFAQAQHFLDSETENGAVTPGRKARSIYINTGQADASGYAMLQLFTREGDKAVFQGVKLLCVQPADGEVKLQAAVDPAFLPSIGQEVCILAQHDVPCAITVSILDAAGRTVRRLAYEEPTRPQQLKPEASSFYWDGRDGAGSMMPAGVYTVQLKARLNGRVFLCESGPIELLTNDAE